MDVITGWSRTGGGDSGRIKVDSNTAKVRVITRSSSRDDPQQQPNDNSPTSTGSAAVGGMQVQQLLEARRAHPKAAEEDDDNWFVPRMLPATHSPTSFKTKQMQVQPEEGRETAMGRRKSKGLVVVTTASGEPKRASLHFDLSPTGADGEEERSNAGEGQQRRMSRRRMSLRAAQADEGEGEKDEALMARGEMEWRRKSKGSFVMTRSPMSEGGGERSSSTTRSASLKFNLSHTGADGEDERSSPAEGQQRRMSRRRMSLRAAQADEGEEVVELEVEGEPMKRDELHQQQGASGAGHLQRRRQSSRKASHTHLWHEQEGQQGGEHEDPPGEQAQQHTHAPSSPKAYRTARRHDNEEKKTEELELETYDLDPVGGHAQDFEGGEDEEERQAQEEALIRRRTRRKSRRGGLQGGGGEGMGMSPSRSYKEPSRSYKEAC